MTVMLDFFCMGPVELAWARYKRKSQNEKKTSCPQWDSNQRLTAPDYESTAFPKATSQIVVDVEKLSPKYTFMSYLNMYISDPYGACYREFQSYYIGIDQNSNQISRIIHLQNDTDIK